MARKGRQITAESLEAKIVNQKEILAKSQAKYEADKAEMLRLVKLRDEMKKDELMAAIAKSKYSVDDVIKMVKGRKRNTEDED